MRIAGESQSMFLRGFRFRLPGGVRGDRFSPATSFFRRSVIVGHSRSKNGVASLAYDPAIQLVGWAKRSVPTGRVATSRLKMWRGASRRSPPTLARTAFGCCG
jgi:hypothetical protein